MLPITAYKKEIVDAVLNHDFTIISAETGSGKSTQVPQYLAEIFSQVVVTEPRIMAAKTLAYRVAEEMGVTVGQEVGYRSAYDKCSSPDSKILFCTDGLHLIRTMFSENTEQENVLVIDEVHDWNLNIETLIAWCKFMKGKWNTKVVAMSATMDTDAIAKFFGEDVAVLSIPGTLYDVKVEERLKYELISTIKEKISEHKNILVFVAGKKEISSVIYDLSDENATVLPLHGEMDWDDQKKCFGHYANSKVIVATNVAQTSLTIPDIDVVVDTGEARISIAEDGIQGLFLKDISKADIFQRKGRAGRTKEGEYFLCSDTSIEWRDEYSVPEIQRSILDRVVLQLAVIGLDAEILEFYHQPDVEAIRKAKKELEKLGALDSDNQVTEIGYKMVKIPVSVQLARMIIEAEKYGVTEQVMTIAAIIEMGGLLGKDSSYSHFTAEKNSDLLAELDVWNSIIQMGYIDFKELGIKKKTFFKIKEHLKKLREVLYGIVEMKSNDDRQAVLKSCLSGLVSHIYYKVNGMDFYGEDRTYRRLDKNSCINNSFYFSEGFLVGIPKTIEFIGRWEEKGQMQLISFASKVDLPMLLELAPNTIQKKTSIEYSSSTDAVKVTIKSYFAGCLVDSESYIDYENPEYDRLKAEYEEEQRRYESRRLYSFIPEPKKTVIISGKAFEVEEYTERPIVYLDEKTIFTAEEDQIFLDDGRRVWFCYSYDCKRESIKALRNVVEFKRIQKRRENKKYEYSQLKATSLEDVISHSDKLGEIELARRNGGESVLVYGCLSLGKNKVSFDIVNDAETANSNTTEALQYLFMEEMAKKYGETKFSHQKGKKRKNLTDSEKAKKLEFNSLVREILPGLTIDNVAESLEFLEEYYQDLMK